jgi:hypothetical protein
MVAPLFPRVNNIKPTKQNQARTDLAIDPEFSRGKDSQAAGGNQLRIPASVSM